MKRLPASFSLLLLVLIGGIALIVQGRVVTSAALSNAGWVMLNERLTQPADDGGELSGQQTLFAQASALHDANQSAAFGRGLTYALQGQTDEAIGIWTTAAGSGVAALSDYGVMARDSGKLDVALTQFRAAAALAAPADLAEQGFLAGTVCQRAFSRQRDLSAANQAYCAGYWQMNGDNLVVNPSFANGSTTGWQGQHFFLGGSGARLTIGQAAGTNSAVARLEGRDERNHFGLFQRLTLSPGDRVRFSGRFKTDGDDTLKARLLYVGWKDNDGASQGNQAALSGGQSDWILFEREFTVPQDSQGSFDFYPALFSGVGNVWFDDIRLQLIRD